MLYELFSNSYFRSNAETVLNDSFCKTRNDCSHVREPFKSPEKLDVSLTSLSKFYI